MQFHSMRRLTLAALIALMALSAASAVAQGSTANDVVAPARVLSTQGNDAAAAANVLSTRGNEGARQAHVVSTRQLDTPETVRRAFERRFPDIEISVVVPTPYPGLYEVRIGTDLLYTDANVDYVFQGSLIDAKSRTDLTAERLDELSRVDFSSLPLDLAIKQVKGDGSRQMAVFEDPNCGYCKQLHRSLSGMDDITVYTFLFPILSPDSTAKARNIWCADDQAATWRAWMINGEVPGEARCDTPIDTLLELGRGLMVQGTPAIIFADGSRVNGALPRSALEQKLNSSPR